MDEERGSLIRNASVGAAVVDCELRILQINEWFSAGNGLPAEALVGRPLEEACPEHADQLITWLQKVIDTNEPIFEVEVGVRVAGPGSTRLGVTDLWLLSAHPIRNGKGSIQEISIVVHDITAYENAQQELQTAQQYLDSVLANIPVGVAILDGPDFRYRRLNPRLAEINGLPVDDHLGRTLAEILPDAAPDILPGLRRVLTTGEPRLDREFSARLPKDPEVTRHFIDSFFPIKGADGKVRAVGVTVLEITARKRAEEALEASYAELEQRVDERTAQLTQANAALRQEVFERKAIEEAFRQQRGELAHVLRTATMGELTATLAHELNQPLQAIRSNAEAGQLLMAADAPDLNEIGDILHDIIDDNQRAVAVIRHMRALLSKHQADTQPVDINEIVVEVTDLVHGDAVIRNVAVDMELADALPLVAGDRVQLQQVCLNLILNGFDAMQEIPVDDRRLTIQTAWHGESAVCVSVRDTGIGFSEPERLFAAFHTTKEA
ncbi:MAG: PAS domain-containing protein, partial [Gammaproteobacteria bacterium]|nr:PAS domain-containing protein [Gammaproteobacteria bacterium]